MKISRIFISVWLFFVVASTSPLAWAQNENPNPDAVLLISARLINSSCILSAANTNTQNNNVFVLPPMTSTTRSTQFIGIGAHRHSQAIGGTITQKKTRR